jgi:hypothetical protein
MSRLVTYNSEEGEIINEFLHNEDLTKLVESFLFNDAYLRVTLPPNIGPKTKQYANMNTILDYKDFTAFYAFHYEKIDAKTTTDNIEVQTRINKGVQNFITALEKKHWIVLDHYVDFRFSRITLSLIVAEKFGNAGALKIVVKDFDLTEKGQKLAQN